MIQPVDPAGLLPANKMQRGFHTGNSLESEVVKYQGRVAKAGKDAQHSKADETDKVDIDRSLLTGNEAYLSKEQQFTQIQELKITHKFYEDTEQIYKKLFDAVDGFVKRYPPFLQGSKEHVQAMRQIVSIRKQIDQLTVPPVKDVELNSKLAELEPDIGIPQVSTDTSSAELKKISEQVIQALGLIDKQISSIEEEVSNISGKLFGDDSTDEGKAEELSIDTKGKLFKESEKATPENEESLTFSYGTKNLSEAK